MTMIDSIRAALRRLRGKAPPRDPGADHRRLIARYRNFRALLSANTHALEAMAELEQALGDGRTLSMTFIRARCTAVAVNVYKIIDHLNQMADDRYHGLRTVFTQVQQTIDALLDSNRTNLSAILSLPLAEIGRHQVELTGEKMANLGEVGTLAGMRIPPGFALTTAASQRFFIDNKLYPAINHLFQQMDIADLHDLHGKSAAIRELIRQSPLPPELESLLYQQYDTLAAGRPHLLVAMRSSALGEDLGQASFAGLYHTELNVDRAHLVEAYKAVLASKYSPRAISYRLAKGYRHEDTEMAVGCLAMIEAVCSGICYSRTIAGTSDCLDLFFAGGGAKGIVDGSCETHHLLLERTPPHQMVAGDLTDQRPAALLSPSQAVALAALAMQLENHFGIPQDIEWSIDPAGHIVVLQSRPITIAGGPPPPRTHRSWRMNACSSAAG